MKYQQNVQHLDASEGVFFSRQLETIKSQTYDIKYPELKARRFVPVSNEANPGAKTVTYRQYDKRGRAKITAPGATDAPRVDVLGAEFTRPVRLVTDAYGYHLLEIRSAAMAGLPLEARRANAARQAIELVLDEVAAVGSPDNGIASGLLNDPGVDIDAGSDWLTGTADDIIAEIATMYQNTTTDTNGVENPDTLLLPDAQYARIAMLPRATTSDTTVLRFILANFPNLTAVEPWYRLAGAGAAGVDRGILYKRAASHVQQEIPSEFEQLPVFQRGQNFEIECMATTAGTVFYYPRSARYIDDIGT